MTRLKELILPAFLLLCLLFGGSSQAIWGNALLQILAAAILAWAALAPDPQAIAISGRRLLQIVGAGVLLVLVQLVPLPPAIWAALPGRDFVESGFVLLGMPLPSLPVSLSIYDTLGSALTLLPPLALLVGMLRLRAWSSGWMLLAVILGAAISIMLGIFQVSSGGDGSFYFYERTNLGVAVGMFANGNHFATLLLATLPLVAALATARWRSATKQQDRALIVALGLAAGAVLAFGILINRSSAMLLIGPPVAAATAMLIFRLSSRRIRQGLVAIALLLAMAAAGVFIARDVPAWGIGASIETRADYWAKSLAAAKDHALTGSGFGTFSQVYRQYEDPSAVDRWYVNHAHNDYLELAVEGGIPAVILVVIFLWWWAGKGREAWMSPTALEQKGALVATAAILLHSVVDYPLRTAGIAGVFAVCLALLAGARGAARQGAFEDADQPRHATL